MFKELSRERMLAGKKIEDNPVVKNDHRVETKGPAIEQAAKAANVSA